MASFHFLLASCTETSVDVQSVQAEQTTANAAIEILHVGDDASPLSPDFSLVYRWRRSNLKGRRCRIVQKCVNNQVLIEFESGQRIYDSRNSVVTSRQSSDSIHRPNAAGTGK